jgi:large subunit ribosomal protein L22
MAPALTKSVARFVRVSPSKARLVARLIRGKSVAEALAILHYSPQAAARLVEKVLRSAAANAEHNHQVRGFEDLRVGAVIDGGPRLKRIQPRAMGRAYRIMHRTSHITITLSQVTNGQPPRPAERGRRPAGAPAAPPPRDRTGATPAPRKPAAGTRARKAGPRTRSR